MNNYLLSNGQITTDEVKYVIDYIKVFLTIHSRDIPYTNWGNEMDLMVNTKEDIITEIKNAVETAITKVNSETKVETSLQSCEFDENNNIRLKLTIDRVTWEIYLNQQV